MWARLRAGEQVTNSLEEQKTAEGGNSFPRLHGGSEYQDGAKD